MTKKVRIMGLKAIPIWLMVLALVTIGAGAAAGTVLAGKVVGEMPVAVSQALLVRAVNWTDNATIEGENPEISAADMTQQVFNHIDWIQKPNRHFGEVADDNTGFQAAAEMAVGDWSAFDLRLKNASEVDLVGLLTLNVPEGLEVEVYADPAATNINSVIRIGLNTWKVVVEAGAEGDAITDDLTIVISVDDTTPPGYYNISGQFQQIGY